MGLRTTQLDLVIALQDRATVDLRKFESGVIRTVGAVASALTALGVIAFPVTSAAAFQRTMADVAKTTGYTDQQINRLSESLVVMSTKLGVAVNDLGAISASAGQMGLSDFGRKAIEAFTESTARASVTLDMTAENAADGGAQIASIFNIAVQDIERVYAAINSVSNASVATGESLLDILKRVGTTAGATFQQVTALGGVSAQFGIPNEQAGTALVKMLGDQLSEAKKFSSALGLTQTEWVAMVKKDAIESFKYVLTFLAQMEDAAAASLSKKLFGSGRQSAIADKFIGDAKAGFKVLNSMLDTATKGYADGTSALDEYARIMNTVTEQVNVLKASFVGLGIEAGKVSLGPLQVSVENISATFRDPAVVDYFGEMGKSIASLVGYLGDFTQGLAGVNAAWSNIITSVKIFLGIAIVKTITGWALALTGKLVGAVARAARALSWLARAVAALPALLTLGAGGLAAFAVAAGPVAIAVGAAASVLYYFRKEVGDFFGFIDDAAAERKQDEIRAKNAYTKAKADAIADYEEDIQQVKKILDTNKAVLGADQKQGYILELSTDEAQKEVTRLAGAQALLLKSSADASRALAAQQTTVYDLRTAIRDNRKETEGLVGQLAQLAREREGAAGKAAVSFLFDPDPTTAADPLLNISKMDEAIKTTADKIVGLKSELPLLERKFSEADETLQRYAKSLTDINKGMESVKDNQVLKLVDQDTADYLARVVETQRAQEELTAAIKKRDEAQRKVDANKEAGDTSTVDENVSLEKQVQATGALQAKVEGLTAAQDAAYASLTNNQRNLGDAIGQGLGVNSLTYLVSNLQKSALESGDLVARLMKQTGVSTIFAYIQNKKLADSYGLLSKAAEAYKTTAKSVMDNTATEIMAMDRSFQQFAFTFITENTRIRNALASDNLSGKIANDIELQTNKLTEYYDVRIAKAEEAGNVDQASMLKSMKQLRLMTAQNEGADKEAEVRAESLRQEYASSSERAMEYMAKSKEFNERGQVASGEALKKQAAQEMDQAQKVLSEMMKLNSTKSENQLTATGYGPVKVSTQVFNQDELDKYLTQLEGINSKLMEGTQATNKASLDAATKVAEKWSAAASEANTALVKSKTLIEGLRATFREDLEPILANATKAFENSTTALSAAVMLAENIAAQSYAGAVQYDPSGIDNAIRQTKEISDAALGAGREVSANLSASALAISQAVARFTERSVPVGTTATGGGPMSSDAVEGAILRSTIIDGPSTTVQGALSVPRITVKEAEIDQFLAADGKKLKVVYVADSLVDMETGRILGKAAGGPITGPGTGTSDSIPIWASNGEYMVDALTTSVFGSAFFAGLQGLARGRRSVSSAKKGLQTLSNGGPVTSSGRSVGSVDINAGGRQFTLYGEYRQAADFVDTISRMKSR